MKPCNPAKMRDTVDRKSRTDLVSTSQDARIVRTRAALQQAMIDLTDQEPFEAVTVRAIAAKAGVGYATFFRHYPDKESLLADVAEVLTLDLLQMMNPLFLQGNSLAAAQALCAFVVEHLSIHQALLAGGAGDAIRSWLLPQIMAKVKAGVVVQRHDPISDVVLFHSVSATLNLMAWWLRQPTMLAPDDAAAIIDRLVLVPAIQLRKSPPFPVDPA